MDAQPKILIIDDEQIARMALESLLESLPYSLFFAVNGFEGLEKAEILSPDLIICDVMMPGMDGFEVCRKLRSLPHLAEVPIIMLSALDDMSSRITGLDAGADDFLNKPFNRLDLQARLRTILRLDRFRRLKTEREKLENANLLLEKQNIELKNLSQKLITAQEDERRALAIELHDEIGQQLTALKLFLGKKDRQKASLVNEHLTQAHEIVSELLQHVREMSLELRPTILDDLGICAALDWLCKRFSKQTGMQIVHNIDPMNQRRFDRTVEIAIFRLVQEALTNAARHAQVEDVAINLSLDQTSIQVDVTDEGNGFEISKTNAGNSSGLSGMRERVHLAGGVFNLHSSPRGGTRIQAHFEFPPTMEA